MPDSLAKETTPIATETIDPMPLDLDPEMLECVSVEPTS
jgi:hypothetical protein